MPVPLKDMKEYRFQCTRPRDILFVGLESLLTCGALITAGAYARALLGTLLENLPDPAGAAQLRATLNPLTTYRLGLSATALPNRAA